MCALPNLGKGEKTNLANSQCFCFVSTSGLVLAQGCWTTVKQLYVARSHRFLLTGLSAPSTQGLTYREWLIVNLCDDNGFSEDSKVIGST